MRLNWFSPLPPARTGIADFTAQLMPFLCAQAEVTVWTDQEHWDRLLASIVQIRPYNPANPPWHDLNRAEVSVYHIGNHAGYHGNIWRMSQFQPGIMVLHDLHLHHFVAGLNARHPWGYIDAMSQCYGLMGSLAAERYLNDQLSIDWLSKRFPLTELVVADALGVVVHTTQASRAVRRLVRCPVLHASLPYRTDARGSAPQVVRQFAAYRLIMFGHVGRNRCLYEVLQALAQFPWRDRFILDIYGAVEEKDDIVSLIRELTLENSVRLHGHVPESVLDTALAGSDLAINLRYPTMFEASHSQLRIWHHALPSIVTRIGWYAGIPLDAAAMVRPRHEIADLQRIWSEYLRDPARFANMGIRGKRLLQERHAPKEYVTSFLDFAREVDQGKRMRTIQAVQLRAKELADKDFSEHWQHRLRQTVAKATRSLGWLGPGGSIIRPPHSLWM